MSAKKQLISDLKTAQSASMKSKNLDEANAIAAAIKQAEADITAIDGVRFTIQAAPDWQHTITVRAGRRCTWPRAASGRTTGTRT